MQYDISDALDAIDTPELVGRRPTTSRYDFTPAKLSRKTNTKTNVVIVSPKTDELRALNITQRGRHHSTSFEIQRIIPGLNKSGTLYERPDLRNPKLNTLNPKKFNPEDKATSAWRLGTFVLVVKGATSEFRKVRNLFSDGEVWNARSLQVIHRPWGLPSCLPYDDGGVPLKIVFPKRDMSVKEGGGRAFEAGEPLLVLTTPGEDPDVMLPVIDFEGYRGEVYKLDVSYGVVEVPWGVLVNKHWWLKQIDLFNQETRCWANIGLIQKIASAQNSLVPSSRMLVHTTRVTQEDKVPLAIKSLNDLNKHSVEITSRCIVTPQSGENEPALSTQTVLKRKIQESSDLTDSPPKKKQA